MFSGLPVRFPLTGRAIVSGPGPALGRAGVPVISAEIRSRNGTRIRPPRERQRRSGERGARRRARHRAAGAEDPADGAGVPAPPAAPTAAPAPHAWEEAPARGPALCAPPAPASNPSAFHHFLNA